MPEPIEPHFENGTARDEDRHDQQDPVVVSRQSGGEDRRDGIRSLTSNGSSRYRSDGSEFTVASIGRWPDPRSVHHVDDIRERILAEGQIDQRRCRHLCGR
jgi:hypothetical protein